MPAFTTRHIGAVGDDRAALLAAVGYSCLDDLGAAGLPAQILLEGPLDLPPALSEAEAAAELAAFAAANRPVRDDRARLPRHPHTAGDPSQRAGESGLVHRLHPVPA